MLVRVILGVEDQDLRTRLVRLTSRPQVHVVSATGFSDATTLLRSRSYDLALVDADAADQALHELLPAMAKLPDRPQLVVLLHEDQAETRAHLLAAGALAVLGTSLSDELLEPALVTLIEQRRTDRRTRSARLGAPRAPDLISVSPRMLAVIDTAHRVATVDSSVLLIGETGVGKERIAELIHKSSARSDGPFVPINCAAIPAELFESELFGHEKGAFTGAHRARRGLFELAHHGTLFLDEVGDVPNLLQPKLLRALQEQTIRPLGAESSVDVDVRVIAATNRDLAADMASDRFRRDLYYRLSVVEIVIPALRDRPEDVLAMATAFAERFRAQMGREVDGFEPRALQAILEYAWPGNVRELVNVVERAVLLGDAERIRLSDLPSAVAACIELADPPLSPVEPMIPSTSTTELDRVVDLPPAWAAEPWRIVREGILLAGERAYLTALLHASQGRVGDSARKAGISNRALFEKMRRHGLRKEDFRAPDDPAKKGT